MKLKNLLIKDFRGIDKLYLDFQGDAKEPSRLIVLAGPNGAGKTTILDAILLSLGRYDLLKQQLTPAYRQVRHGEKDFAIQARYKVDSEDKLNAHLMDIPVVLDDWEIGGASFEFGLAEPDVLHILFPGAMPFLFTGGKDHLSPGTRKLYESLQALNYRVEYYSAWREAELVGPLGVSAGVQSNSRGTVVEKEEKRLELIKQSAINATFHAKFGKKEEFSEVYLHKWNSYWNGFHENRNDRFEVGPISDNPDEGFDFYLHREDGAIVPLNMLSSGELELLKFFRLTMRKELQDGIILIDEPEQHLHPKWHRMILPMILDLAPRAQVICATHSPQLISMVSPENVFLLKKENNRIVSWRPESTFGMDSNRILEDLLDTPERPMEIKMKLQYLFELIDVKELTTARAMLDQLRKEIPHDSELVRAETLLLRKRAIGR